MKKQLHNVLLPLLCQKQNIKYYFCKFIPTAIIRICSVFLKGINAVICAWLPKQFIDTLIDTSDLTKAFYYIVLLVLFLLLNRIVQLVETYLTGVANEKIKLFGRKSFLLKNKNLYSSFFDVAENKDLYQFAQQFSESGCQSVLDIIYDLASNLIGILSIIIILPNLPYWLYILIALLTVYRFMFHIMNSKLEHRYIVDRNLSMRKRDYFSGLLINQNYYNELNLNNAIDGICNRFESEFQEYLSYQKKYNKKKSCATFFAFLSYPIQNILLYGILGISLLRGNLTIGEYYLMFAAIAKLSQIIEYILDFPSKYYPLILKSQKLSEYYSKTHNYRESSKNEKIKIDKIVKVEFKEVSFKYEKNASFNLNKVSFVVDYPCKIALIGPNGAGKSTILKLMLKIYTPSAGQILINGIDITEIDRESLWKCAGVVFQNINIYSLTLEENIALSEMESICDDKVIDALKSVRLDKYIEQRKSLVTRNFSSQGLVFSGGENQRIAISRALYKKPSLLVLDEPTSALDPLSEQELIDIIINKIPDSIMIYSTHRLSNCTKADEVLLIDKGELVAQGSHMFLYANNLLYREMFSKQAQGYTME